MASQYDTLIQNLGVEGLSKAVEVIAELAGWGAETTLAVGDVQSDLRKRLNLAPNRSKALIDCFVEARVIDFDEPNRALILTNAMPWGADDAARQATLIHKLRQAKLLEADETADEDALAPDRDDPGATQKHGSTEESNGEQTQKHQPPSGNPPKQRERALSDNQEPEQALEENLAEQQEQPAPAPHPVTNRLAAEEPPSLAGLDSTQARVDQFAAALGMSDQQPASNTETTSESTESRQQPTDTPSEPQQEHRYTAAVETPEPQPPPASAGFGRGAGRVSAVVRPTGKAVSAEDMLKAAGVTGTRSDPQPPAANPIPARPTPTAPPKAPDTSKAASTANENSASQPGANATSDQPASAENPQPERPRWGKQPPPPTAKPTPAPPGAGRGTTLRPGAAPASTPPVGNVSSTRRPGAEPPPTRGTPAWQARRGGAPYGQNPQPKSEEFSEELKRLLLGQQARTSLTLDIQTLRALSQEINQYLSKLEQANLAGDTNLRVELQTLLDQIEQRRTQEDDGEDA